MAVTNCNKIADFPQNFDYSVQKKRINTIAMLGGASIGIATGCLKFANKLKAGIIGSAIGLITDKLIGFLINPRIYND